MAILKCYKSAEHLVSVFSSTVEGKGCTPTGGQSDVARSDCEHAQYHIHASWGIPCIVILSMGAVTLGDNTCAMCAPVFYHNM